MGSTAPIADLMTADPVVLGGDDSIAMAVQKMAVGGFRHIPLLDDGRPVDLGGFVFGEDFAVGSA